MSKAEGRESDIVPYVNFCFGNANKGFEEKGPWRFREKEMENLSARFLAKLHESVFKFQQWRHDSTDNMNRKVVGWKEMAGKFAAGGIWKRIDDGGAGQRIRLPGV